jgi:hypothetical protein
VYTAEVRSAELTGTVIFSTVSDKESRLKIVWVMQNLGMGLEEGAAEALSKSTFKPGHRQGKAVYVALTMDFDLK